MPLPKKITACISIAIILIMLIININPIYAEEVFPLEDGEVLIEEKLIDKDSAEIFTQIGEDLYIKQLKRNEGQWVVENTEAIQPRGTGLRIKETDRIGSLMLAEALEKELGSYGLETASLPSIIDYSNSEFLPPAGNQGDENSCVGWATGYYLRTYQQAKDIGWEVKGSGGGIASHIFSPSFIYNQIRQETDLTDDGGAYIDDAGDLLRDMGVASIEDFPYILYDIYTMPDQADIQSAIPHKIKAWSKLYGDANTDQYIIQKTKEYLNTGDLVVAAGWIGPRFMDNRYKDVYGNSIIIREPYSPYGHAFIIVGYNDTLVTPDGVGAFKLVNSWGADWGNNGFSYISYQEFAYNAIEGYVFTDLLNAQPRKLDVDVSDTMVFNIDFAGTGRFDVKIKDANGQLVYEENNHQAQEGIYSFPWYGQDKSGNIVADGSYKISIIPYNGDMPKPAFEETFSKPGKEVYASAKAYSYEGAVQYVDIPMVFMSDGVLNITVEYNGVLQDMISRQTVKAGESQTYRITKEDFDFNNIDLDKVKIIIDIS